MTCRPLFRLAACALVALPFLAAPLRSQENVAQQIAADRAILAKETYEAPPPEITRLVTAPRYQNVTLTLPSPDRTHFLRQESDGLPSVHTFGKAHYYFAGLQVDPKANRARTLTTRGLAGLSLIDATTGEQTAIMTPKGATVSSPVWSPDGTQLAYIANFDGASQAYVADVATGRSALVAKAPLLATLVTTLDWTADGRSVIAVLVPDGRDAEPRSPEIAQGPRVRLWLNGAKEPERNFASLLDEPYDMELMKYYVTGQLAVIDVKTHAVKKIGAPAMISSVDASPDALYFRVTTMQEPFSYVVQYGSFGTVEELWDGSGKVVAEIQKRPLREGQEPDTAGGGRGGRTADAKRDLAWMPQGAGMYYLESEPSAHRGGDTTDAAPAPGGRGGATAARKDRLVEWLPPFGKADTKVLYTASGQMSGVLFSDDAKTIFVTDNNSGTGDLYAVNLADTASKHVILRQRGYAPSFTGGRGGRGGAGGGGGGRGGAANDSLAFYRNPGAMLSRRGTLGGDVAMVTTDGNGVFLTGTQYSPDFLANPPQAFVDRYDIRTGQRTRIFEGPTNATETVVEPLDNEFNRAIVSRETPTDVGNSYLWVRATGQLTKLTDNKDYTPEFTSLIRKRIPVTRPDGFKFVVNLTLPADYRAGTRLPGMFWFYPYEYTTQAEYDRTLRTENVNRFPAAGPRTIEYLATQGYAVANFDPPIVGENGRMNDNYVSDLVMDLATVIDALDKDGYIDRSRLGIGGHS